MKRKTILFFLLSLSASMATSCGDSGSDFEEPILPIEPPCEPMFQFDEHGIPYRFCTPTLSQEMQQNIRHEAIGYGWKWMQTFEILDDGFVDPTDYYQSRDGATPASYYFKSEGEMVRYFYSVPIYKKAYLEQGFALEPATGTLSEGSHPSGIIPWALYLRIWSVYQLNGKWYMSTIEPLGMREDIENDEYRIIWGASQYYRMSDDELKQMQEEYSYNFSKVN